MTIWQLIGRAYTLPFERRRATIAVFWLPALIWIAAVLTTEYFFRALLTPDLLNAITQSNSAAASRYASTSMAYGAVMVIWAVVYTLVTGSALVRWHRHLVLHQAAERARFWLTGSEWAFVWRWTWLGLLFVLIGLIGLALTLFAALLASGPERLQQLIDGEGFDEQSVTLVMSWVFVLAIGLTGWLLPRKFLSLPAIAIGERDAYRLSIAPGLTRGDLSDLTLAILATSAPLLLFGMWLTGLVSPTEPNALIAPLTPRYVAITVAANLMNFVAIVIFAAMLSLYYRKKATARRRVAR